MIQPTEITSSIESDYEKATLKKRISLDRMCKLQIER